MCADIAKNRFMEIIWWIVLESVQRGTKGIALSYFFIIMLSSFWVMRETLSALRVMSKNTILDKINIYLGMKKERKIEHTAALPICYCKFRCCKWCLDCPASMCGFITKILLWNILAFAHFLNEYYVSWPFCGHF